MIATLTANPSLDLLFELDRLVWDDANRLAEPRRRPGGQGINVARAVSALGGAALAVAPLGGATGGEMRRMLEAEALPLLCVPIAGETRLFVGVKDRTAGRSLLLNPRGPELSESETAALERAVLDALGPAPASGRGPDWLACCGSLPRGVGPDLYARLGHEARRRGVRFVPDCDGASLRLAAESGCDLLVPNRHEAARLLGRPVESVEDAAGAAVALLRPGLRLASVTMGAGGAVAADGDGVWHAEPPAAPVGASAVGAGDAFLAGLILAIEAGAEPAEALCHGVAAGSAVLSGAGSALITAEATAALLPEVRLRRCG